MESILLCRPCAEQLKVEIKITIGTSMRDKNTCQNCGKRRFVYSCKKEIIGRCAKREQK